MRRTANRATTFLRMAAPVLAVVVPLGGPVAAQAAAPIREFPARIFGWEANAITNGNSCSIKSKECQAAKESSSPGGFSFPVGVAVAPGGDIYVADNNNDRVEVLTPGGEFVREFGSPGSGAGEMNVVYSIAIDPTSGNVFVQDFVNRRVDEYTTAGQFVLTIGQQVNQTKDEQSSASEAERNVCTEASADTCKAGVAGTQPGAFDFAASKGDVLAAGGPKDLLYVGDEHRIQEFDPATGHTKGEIPLGPISAAPGDQVVALALDGSEADPEYGDLYAVYREGGTREVIRKFTAADEEVSDGRFPLKLIPRLAKPAEFGATGLAVDASDRVAVSEEESPGQGFVSFGSLIDGRTGRVITEFESPTAIIGLAFGPADALYGAAVTDQGVIAYEPRPVAELLATSAPCKPGPERGTDVTIECTLQGNVDPWGVPQTEVWFEWGRTQVLGERTLPESIAANGPEGVEEPLVPRSTAVQNLRPNATFYYRLAGYDDNDNPPERQLTGETVAFTTPFVAPRIVGNPVASFVKQTSAVLSAELNPEGASTQYFFEYIADQKLEAVCKNGVRSKESCPGVTAIPVLESHVYGQIGTTVEVAGLRSDTQYSFRLFAEGANAGGTERASKIGPEEGFATLPPASVMASTGLYRDVTATSALIEGSVNPDGESATYAFELGVYAGGQTQYGVVASGSTGTELVRETETLQLSGLQPATLYAYRIRAENGFGVAFGQPVVFMTEAIPVPPAPSPSVLVKVPPIPFPAAVSQSSACKRGYRRDKRGRCVKIRKKGTKVTRRSSRRRMVG